MEIKKHLDDFMNHLNNTMVKPETYYYQYTIGLKYYKIIIHNDGVYCFVDKMNGDIFKPAGWKAPAKGKRGSILKVESYIHSDCSGSWLYRRPVTRLCGRGLQGTG